MNVEDLRAHCLSLKGVEETLPFGPDNLVMKVMGKMFCIISLDAHPASCNVKCDPEMALSLREAHTGVLPGYHMNKQHWNTLVFDGSFTDAQARQWLDDSYALIVASLPKKLQTELQLLP
jgi:predicted DNA-binding protein (MmcQ/YjbR family)